MIQQMVRRYMTADEAIAVFRHGLNDELGVATAGRYDALSDGDERTGRVFSAMYRIAARLAPDADDLPVELLDANTPGFSEQDRRAVVLMLRCCAPHRGIGKVAHSLVKRLTAPLNGKAEGDAGVQLLMGRAEAQARMALSGHPDVLASGNPLSALLDDALVARIRMAASTPATPAPPAPRDGAADATPFLMTDTRRLTEVIDAIIVDIQASGDWNEDVAQRGRVIRGSAWITGDKRLCDYGPGDAQVFAATLRKLPTEFRWGTFEKGNMSRPFDEVMAEVSKTKGTKRDNRTVNRDLTTLSRFGGELMKTAWKPSYGKDAVVDFAAFASARSR